MPLNSIQVGTSLSLSLTPLAERGKTASSCRSQFETIERLSPGLETNIHGCVLCCTAFKIGATSISARGLVIFHVQTAAKGAGLGSNEPMAMKQTKESFRIEGLSFHTQAAERERDP